MPLLRLASPDTTRLDLGTDGDWVDVKSELAKKERNAFIKRMPNRPGVEDGLTPGEAVEFQTDLFEALAVGWSADFPCLRDNYLNLPPDAADALDTALAEHFRAMVPTKDDEKKG